MLTIFANFVIQPFIIIQFFMRNMRYQHQHFERFQFFVWSIMRHKLFTTKLNYSVFCPIFIAISYVQFLFYFVIIFLIISLFYLFFFFLNIRVIRDIPHSKRKENKQIKTMKEKG